MQCPLSGSLGTFQTIVKKKDGSSKCLDILLKPQDDTNSGVHIPNKPYSFSGQSITEFRACDPATQDSKDCSDK